MSIITEKYYRGINLGGWLSQCKEMTYEHFDSFISKSDIEILAKDGFDHVRVPFDYDLLESDDEPYVYKEKGLDYLRLILEWCKAYNMNVVLDLHKAPGYSFDTLEDNQLFGDEALMNRMVKLWGYLAQVFLEEGDNLVFELLNEIVEPDSSRWNVLANRAIEEIRAIDNNRYIIVGGNNYNHMDELANIKLDSDHKIIYTFHFYEPFFVTHQLAYWSNRALDYNKKTFYPGVYEGMEDFVNSQPEYGSMAHLIHEKPDFAAIKKYFEPVVAFMKSKDAPLYCGEFGVIALAGIETRENWHEDLMSLLEEHQVGSACWSYKEMDFELYADGKPISNKLVASIANKSL